MNKRPKLLELELSVWLWEDDTGPVGALRRRFDMQAAELVSTKTTQEAKEVALGEVSRQYGCLELRVESSLGHDW